MIFFSNFDCQRYGGTRIISQKKTAAFYAEPNEREEAATSSYSATRDFLKYIYSALVAKNRRRSN